MVYLCKQAFNYPAGITALILSLWILQQTCHYQISHVSNSDCERAAAGKQTQIEMDAAKGQHLVALFSCIVPRNLGAGGAPCCGTPLFS